MKETVKMVKRNQALNQKALARQALSIVKGNEDDDEDSVITSVDCEEEQDAFG